MRGWTGAQYSLWRIAFAIWLASHEFLLALLAIPIALGWRARLWWAMLAVYWVSGFFWVLPGGVMLLVLIVAQLFVPEAPYLSLSRRGKPDPGTDWRISKIAILIALFAPVVEFSRTQYLHGSEMVPATTMFMLLFVFPPRLVIPSRRAKGVDMVFYDGYCALCHGLVRFLLAEDPDGSLFRFAPLGSASFEAAVPADIRGGLPDSIVVKTAAGQVLVQFRAAVYALQRLGGYWRLFGIVLCIVPVKAGDAAYVFIAERRYRVFGKKQDVCPLMPPALRGRFEA